MDSLVCNGGVQEKHEQSMVEIGAVCYRTEEAQIPESAGESAGKSAGKGRNAGNSDGRAV